MHDGAIGPAESATLEWYDPWEIYSVSRRDIRPAPPYTALIALMLDLGAFFDKTTSRWELGERLEDLFWARQNHIQESVERAKILDWCSQFGLLGVLPHGALAIELPRRLGPNADEKVFFEREHFRVNGRWTSFLRAAVEDSDRPIAAVREAMQLLDDNDNPVLGPLLSVENEYHRAPRVTFSRKGIQPLEDEPDMPVGDLLYRFFPNFQNAGDQFECPLLLTPEFWRVYSEHVTDFLVFALAFVEAVAPLDERQNAPDLSLLEGLLEPAGVTLSFDRQGDLQEQWVCPSLLSSFGRMAIQDLFAGMRILRCECCGSPFVTSSYQAHYCSEKCGWRHRKRRTRHHRIDPAPQE